MSEDGRKTTVIYLAGYGHSGTTLLDLIFNGHPDIVGVGSLGVYGTRDRRRRNRHKIFERVRQCCCGAAASDCPFWSQVLDGIDTSDGLEAYMSPLATLFNSNRYTYFNGKPLDEVSYLRTMEEVYRRIDRVSDAKVVFDSSQVPFRIGILARSSCIRLVVLHVVRNGEACIASMKKKDGRSFFRTLLAWIRRNIEIEIVKRRHPEVPYIFVRYEDFVADPPAELSRVLRAVDLKYSPEMLRFRSHVSHNFSGNGHRLNSDLPERIEADKTWRSRIALHEHFLFTAIGGWLNWIYDRRSRRAATTRERPA